jgi:translation elongation factor P/translation initiation factor 5A
MRNILTCLLVILATFCATAQRFESHRKAIKITNSGDTYTTYDIDKPEIKKQLKAQFNATEVEYILTHSDENCGFWPEGVTYAGWNANMNFYKDFKAYHIGVFSNEAQNFNLVLIPASENKHMPKDMRPNDDIIIVFGNEGIDMTGIKPQKPLKSYAEGPMGKRNIQLGEQVFVYDFGDRYSMSYLNSLTGFAEELATKLTPEQVKYFLARGEEDVWPAAIDEMDERLEIPSPMDEYTFYHFMDFEGYTIVAILADDTKTMQPDFQSTGDCYFVFGEKAFDSEVTIAPQMEDIDVELSPGDVYEIADKVKLIDPGLLYSTYDVKNDPQAMKVLNVLFEDYDSTLEIMLDNSTETSWPSAINTFAARNNGTNPLMQYTFVYICSFGDKIMLAVDVESAASLPKSYQSESPIVMVFGKGAIGLKGISGRETASSGGPRPITIDLSSATSFEGVIQRAVLSYVNDDLESLKGEDKKGEHQLEPHWLANACVASKDCEVIESIWDHKNYFKMVWFETNDSLMALEKFNALLEKAIDVDYQAFKLSKPKKTDLSDDLITWYDVYRLYATDGSYSLNATVDNLEIEVSVSSNPFGGITDDIYKYTVELQIKGRTE